MNYFVFGAGIAAAVLLAALTVRLVRSANKKNNEDFRLFSSIANEIHTPLTNAVARLEDLRSDKNLSASAKARIKKIQAELEEMADYTGKILEFRNTRIYNDRRLSVKYINLSLYIEKLIMAFEFRFNPKHIKLIKEIQPEVSLWADTSILQHIMHLILGYIANHSTETFIRIVLQKEGDIVYLKIIDNSKQKDVSDSESINIHLSEQLCRIHKLRFEVRNKNGIGKTYSLRFNAREEFLDALKEESIECPSIPERDNSQPLILLVEDSYEIRQYLEGSFYENFSLIYASNAKEGLELTHKHKPDLIISAVLIPGMNGIEFCRAIKSDPLTENIPFMFYTGIDSSESRAEAYHAGADSYIVKPAGNDVLKERIYNILDRFQRLIEKNIEIGGGENQGIA